MEILESVLGIGLDIILLLYLLKDYKCKFGKNAILCFCVIYLFLVMILNNVLGSSIFRLPIYCSVVWCFIWVFYEEITRKAALKLTALYFVTMQISEMLILGSIVWLGDYDLYEKVVNGNSANTLV